MTVGIYCFTNKINNKKYIGQSINIEKRFKDHKGRHNQKSSSMYSSPFYRALRKYGFENFKFEIIDSNNKYNKEKLNELESFYIKKYDTYYNGYNMNYGGDSVYITHKLKIEEVIKIKDYIKNTNMSFLEIGEKFNVSFSLISQINSGIIWYEIDLDKYKEYPIRKNTSINNIGGTNPNAVLTNEDVITIRERFVEETLPEIYKDYKEKVSFSSFKKAVYGVQFKSLPIYKKREKAWYLNGTCIDYSRLEK